MVTHELVVFGNVIVIFSFILSKWEIDNIVFDFKMDMMGSNQGAEEV